MTDRRIETIRNNAAMLADATGQIGHNRSIDRIYDDLIDALDSLAAEMDMDKMVVRARPKPGDILTYKLMIFGEVKDGPYRIRVIRWKRYGIKEIEWLDGPYSGQTTKWDEYFGEMLWESGQVTA